MVTRRSQRGGDGVAVAACVLEDLREDVVGADGGGRLLSAFRIAVWILRMSAAVSSDSLRWPVRVYPASKRPTHLPFARWETFPVP